MKAQFKDPHSKCFHFPAEVEAETRFDIGLLHKVLMGTQDPATEGLVKRYGVSILSL
eukprot:CAMPEP_0168347810 /NCGR_PEP_ID=MMETSP0213-20121227/19270_1 /TAXON_ID=151035 /ORGANISM="Euplotes harpa, Strain FSP1.4" /LENGTH=56 /DNA_ID=CAMNT_0008357087 /DNA_START=74 /DNA_END=240 /DNA_ORIENTATION=-